MFKLVILPITCNSLNNFQKPAIDIAYQTVAEGMDEKMVFTTPTDRVAVGAHYRGNPVDINEGHRNYKKRKERNSLLF
ncbi:hypothetical protein [Flavisolibacter nicotianae]|uniref:hypothetical protein n=1 Tax=Flavisolibacter nicotianae TaxID=2364882 RepID=UPI000EAEC37C|nr:hypothetical protein [Flavisolibacter nicotianae]